LPLGAHMTAEEQAAHRLLERMAAVADTYRVNVVPRMLHDRVAGDAQARQAVRIDRGARAAKRRLPRADDRRRAGTGSRERRRVEAPIGSRTCGTTSGA